MESFLDELNQSSSAFEFYQINQDKIPVLSTASAAATLPQMRGQIQPTPDAEALLVPLSNPSISSQLNSSESQSTNKDNKNYTIMSYYDVDPAPQQYQTLDIKALQYLYGESDGGSINPSVKINDIYVKEGDFTKRAKFKISLDAPATQTVKVDYQTVDDTAWSGYDYRYKSGTITFKPGQKTKKIKVPVYGINYYTGDLGFWVYLSNPQNAQINGENDQWGHCWILEDDF